MNSANSCMLKVEKSDPNQSPKTGTKSSEESSEDQELNIFDSLHENNDFFAEDF